MTTINTNTQSLNAQRNLATSAGSLSTSMQRLSSGSRVNSAKDDAAGLAISERMSAQVRGMNVAIRNANDGISLAQTAEGVLGRVTENLQRMRELAVQSANDTNSATDRDALNLEFDTLGQENRRVLQEAEFNGQKLLTGWGPGDRTFAFQVGANTSADNQINIVIPDAITFPEVMSPTTIGGWSPIASATDALFVMSRIDVTLTRVSAVRANFGAAQNRFESVIANLRVASENQSAARGRIMDADFAAETANLSRGQILQQAGTAMVAQANQLPQGVLSLLR